MIDPFTLVVLVGGVAAGAIASVPGSVYVATQADALAPIWPLIAVAAVGVVVGTILGAWTLRNVPERIFRRLVGGLLVLLGLYTLRTLQP